MAYIHIDFTKDIYPVGVQLAMDGEAKPDAELDFDPYATWYKGTFPGSSHQDIDRKLTGEAECSLRRFMARHPSKEATLRRIFTDAIRSAAKEIPAQVPTLKRAGLKNPRVSLGRVDIQSRLAGHVKSGACVEVPLKEFVENVKAGRIDGYLETLMEKFYLINSDMLRNRLELIEEAKVKGVRKVWWRAQLADGTPFAVAFAQTSGPTGPGPVTLLLAAADRNALPYRSIVYGVSPDLKVGLATQPAAPAAPASLDVDAAVERVASHGRKPEVRWPEMERVVQVTYEAGEYNPFPTMVDVTAGGRALDRDEVEALLATMVCDAKYLAHAERPAPAAEAAPAGPVPR